VQKALQDESYAIQLMEVAPTILQEILQPTLPIEMCVSSSPASVLVEQKPFLRDPEVLTDGTNTKHESIDKGTGAVDAGLCSHLAQARDSQRKAVEGQELSDARLRQQVVDNILKGIGDRLRVSPSFD